MVPNKDKSKTPAAQNSLEALETYYGDIFGPRWPSLRQALCRETPQINLRGLDDLGNLSKTFEIPENSETFCGNALQGDYWLDPASILLANLLPLAALTSFRPLGALLVDAPPVDAPLDIWDMCAAPGGKMLCLALRHHVAQPKQELRLLASEVSKARFQRLIQQRDLLPRELRQQVELKNANACHLALRYKAEGRKFHAILLDAPCSSERHLVQKTLQSASTSQKLAQSLTWSLARSKRNAQNQTALLCSALDCLLPGGFVLYATCSLSPTENAGVVQRALKKRSTMGIRAVALENASQLAAAGKLAATGKLANAFSSLHCEAQTAPRSFGYSILPDRNNGSGPLYFCLLQKEPET